MKFGRNLTAAEILDQVLHFRRIEPVNHLVFMGMGEPMMNLDNVLAASSKLPDIGITHRRTGISTVGWVPGIKQLTESDMPIRLALSLHAPDDELRSQIMPVNDRYPLHEVLAACEAHYEKKRRQIFIEYVMLAGVNDGYGDAVRMARDPRSEDLQGQPDPVQPDGLGLRRQLAQRDRRPSRPRSRSTACAPPSASPAAATSTPPAASSPPNRPLPRLDRRARADHGTGRVERLHGDVGRAGDRGDRGLEARVQRALDAGERRAGSLPPTAPSEATPVAPFQLTRAATRSPRRSATSAGGRAGRPDQGKRYAR